MRKRYREKEREKPREKEALQLMIRYYSNTFVGYVHVVLTCNLGNYAVDLMTKVKLRLSHLFITYIINIMLINYKYYLRHIIKVNIIIIHIAIIYYVICCY